MKTTVATMCLALWLSGCTTTPPPSAAPGEVGIVPVSAASVTGSKVRPGAVQTMSGLQYEIIRGGSGIKPTPRDFVHVVYIGRLLDTSEVIDKNSKDKVPDRVRVNSVIAGWQEGLQLMSEGSIYRFHIPPHLAYGEKGAGSIGPNQVLVYDIELVRVEGEGERR
jgi:FKBP-type peptidyl-prolyl cis-trans isomerase FkpA